MVFQLLELTIASLVFMLDGNNKNITNKNSSPLARPNMTPRNLSKPEAPDHLISFFINFITIPPRNIKIKNTTT